MSISRSRFRVRLNNADLSRMSSLLIKILILLGVAAAAVFVLFQLGSSAASFTFEFREDVIDLNILNTVRREANVGNLSDVNLDELSTRELLLTMHSHIDNANTMCNRKIRMGYTGDGGWEICDDPDVRPRVPCIIYSFGISYDFSFDDDAAKLYGCHVYSFDPSMRREKDFYDRSSHVHFYKIGLSGTTYVNQDNKWLLMTFRDIREKLGHTNTTVDIVKMDIESSEWEALPEMVASGELRRVKQLLLEYHLVDQTRDYLLPRLKAIQAVESVGFQKFYVHKNHACTVSSVFPVTRTRCYEVHYLKR
ncbi:probable methyltransferase-like protein 24 isoform X2 [Biomphalaria glabrata]|uniref:Probable methyltransferase-like protein 24 isoform X2 n=1 Tax=Biomphalaria glabrata TaxID=6526 RepID=A0A9U8EBW5_BIOGL|nr:probable methyltransferase-like protein 24 isoform X2 [Biomphalaria glabrata]